MDQFNRPFIAGFGRAGRGPIRRRVISPARQSIDLPLITRKTTFRTAVFEKKSFRSKSRFFGLFNRHVNESVQFLASIQSGRVAFRTRVPRRRFNPWCYHEIDASPLMASIELHRHFFDETAFSSDFGFLRSEARTGSRSSLAVVDRSNPAGSTTKIVGIVVIPQFRENSLSQPFP